MPVFIKGCYEDAIIVRQRSGTQAEPTDFCSAWDKYLLTKLKR